MCRILFWMVHCGICDFGLFTVEWILMILARCPPFVSDNNRCQFMDVELDCVSLINHCYWLLDSSIVSIRKQAVVAKIKHGTKLMRSCNEFCFSIIHIKYISLEIDYKLSSAADAAEQHSPIQQNISNNRKTEKLQTHKNMGQLWGVYSEDIDENKPCYNKNLTLLIKIFPQSTEYWWYWLDVHICVP